MLESKKNAALGMMLGALLVGGTAVQASAQDTSQAAPSPQDTSAYSAPSRSDTSAPSGINDSSAVSDSSAIKAGEDSTGMSKMHSDSAWTDTSKAGDKAWRKNTESDTATTR